MDKQRKSKRPKTIVASSSEEVSSVEWEEIGMSKEEEDLIWRMYKLVGERWDLIAGRIPGRTPQDIYMFCVFNKHPTSQFR